jgi:CheY-like chemotaxis protein
MPQGGVVRLSAANAILEEGPLPLPAGRYVQIEVSDLGVGIAAEHLGRIFDPYFTTKQRGSGLGLTTAYSIVESHGGHLAATSQLGEGSTFGVYLPAVGASPDARQEKPTGLVRGQGRVLVMDDEEMVRRLAGLMLARLGYEAELAGDGVEALECYRRAQAEGRGFAAVIMDLTVPGGMGGREAIARLLELDPNARAIVSSGYSNDPIMAQYRSHGFRAVIAKPYTLQGLSQVLQRVVAGQEGQQR